MMVPVGRLVILRTVPKAELISALAWLTIPALMGPVIGPPLGGFITTYISWRWIFWINIPIGMLGVILATLLYRQHSRGRPAAARRRRASSCPASGWPGLPSASPPSARDLFPPAVVAGLLAAGIVGCSLYVRHARAAPAPLLDLDLLKVDTFFASVVGGFLFRIGIGAMPFLLPLMLQLGFGLTPFQSGLLTFAGRRRRHRHEDHRRADPARASASGACWWSTLVLSSLFLAAIALFTPARRTAIILAVLLVGGFFKSLAIHQHQLDRLCRHRAKAMSRATSFASVAQQLSLSAGVAIGALVLEVERMGRPERKTCVAGDFPLAFVVVAAISATSSLIFTMLPKEAGASLSAPWPTPCGEQDEPASGLRKC